MPLPDFFLFLLHDYDIFTNASGEQILKMFPQGHVIGGEERQAKILTVVVDGIEVSQYRSSGDRTETGTSLYQHLSTCDFTMNAIARGINSEDYIDPFDGLKDIDRRLLRFVGDAEDRIKEDPLRLFRGIRFMSKYDLNIFGNEDKIFKNFEKYVKDLPKERIREEFMKIIITEKGVINLSFFGMLEYIIPEFQEIMFLDGGPHHGETVGHHSLMAHHISLNLTNNPLVVLAILLHDIGKAKALPRKDGIGEYDYEDVFTFYSHHTIGAEYVTEWMKEYKFSDSEIRFVTTMIKHHMMGKTGTIKQSTFTKICDELNKAGISPEDMLTLTYCDNQANLKNARLKFNEFIRDNGFYQRYYEVKYKQRAFNVNDLDIGGLEIAKVLNVEPGPIIGTAKNVLFEAVCEGIIINRKDKIIEYLKIMSGCQNG